MAEPKASESKPDDYRFAYMSVGKFMNYWALLEGTLNTGIGKLLGLGSVETAIATVNMNFRSKIHIVKTLVNLKGFGTKWAKAATKDFDAIGLIADQRNIIAHVPFAPHEGGGVQFLTVKAKGKLAFPGVVWGREEFERYYDEMERLTGRIDEIVNVLEAKRPSLLSALLASANVTPPQQEHENYLGRLSGPEPAQDGEAREARAKPEE